MKTITIRIEAYLTKRKTTYEQLERSDDKSKKRKRRGIKTISMYVNQDGDVARLGHLKVKAEKIILTFSNQYYDGWQKISIGGICDKLYPDFWMEWKKEKKSGIVFPAVGNMFMKTDILSTPIYFKIDIL